MVVCSFLLITTYTFLDDIFKTPPYQWLKITYKETEKIEYKTNKNIYELRVKDEYIVDGIIISKKKYFDYDWQSDLIPFDFVLGWDKMKYKSNLINIDFEQRNRWYYFYMDDLNKTKVTLNEARTMTANTHIIPWNKEIYEELSNLSTNKNYIFYWKLVDVYKNNDLLLKTSTVRHDNGGWACEIFLVEKIEKK